MNKTNIIVGSSGFIGSKLYKYSSQSTKTIGISRTQTDENIINLDIKNFKSKDLGFIDENKIIFFTSAISAPDLCENHYNEAKKINVDATSNFIDQALSLGAKVIFFSSYVVYGEQHYCDEKTKVNPLGRYAEMKNMVEENFLNYSNFKTIRVSYVFSQHDKFLQYLLSCIKLNKTAEIFKNLDRSIISLNDVIYGCFQISKMWNEIESNIINFGGPEVYDRITIAEVIKTNVFNKLKYNVVEPPKNFFLNRPKSIKMASPILSKILNNNLFNFKNIEKSFFTENIIE
jgi:dTDP-4-dehydrorhamnose reductase